MLLFVYTEGFFFLYSTGLPSSAASSPTSIWQFQYDTVPGNWYRYWPNQNTGLAHPSNEAPLWLDQFID